MRIEGLLIVVVALFWGSWPLVSRASGQGGPTGSLILSLASLIPIGAAAIFQGNGVVLPASGPLIRLLIAGMMMGVGLVAFNMVANSEIDASISIPVIDSAMLIVSAAGAIYFFSEPVTTQKIIGITLLLAGIITLRPS